MEQQQQQQQQQYIKDASSSSSSSSSLESEKLLNEIDQTQLNGDRCCRSHHSHHKHHHYDDDEDACERQYKAKCRSIGAGKLVLAAVGVCAAAVYVFSGAVRFRPCSRHKGVSTPPSPPPSTATTKDQGQGQDEAEKWQTEGYYPSPRGGTVKSWAKSYEKAASLVSQMSLLEKVNITTGIGWKQGLCLGNTGPAPSVGFPSLCLQDGPLGLRFVDHATAWPAALTVGATWNRELMYKRGNGHGTEARKKGVNVLLGPSMGPLGKLPAGGRNWEGFGPDPYLQGVAAAETIKGIQDAGVIATAKHYILNEQEHFRQLEEWDGLRGDSISSNVDDRTMHELYLWPFADSVRAGVGSVMCSYNQVNNTYACGNSQTLNRLLKDELGFQGFVQSDWFAQRQGIYDVLGGLDMNMPGNIFQTDAGYTLFGANLTAAVMNSSVPLERLDDMATRIVAAWYQMGQDDPAKFPAASDGPNFSSWTDKETDYIHWGAKPEGGKAIVNRFIDVREANHHWKVARQIAIEGTVLVKNDDGILPLKRGAFGRKSIGIYGEDAGAEDQPGFPNFCKDRGCNLGSLGSGWGSGAVEYTHFHSPLTALRNGFNSTPSCSDSPTFVAITDNSALTSIAASARDQHLCFAFINSDAGEGYITDPITGVAGDRQNLYAQKGGDALVQAVAANCNRTIVVVHAVGPVLVERWIDLPSVRAVLLAHLPGQESGAALAAILFGDESPSGKLPYTVGKSLQDYGPGAELMYEPNAATPQQTFEERWAVDYRYYDAAAAVGVEPRFEFGFGLSYTSFEYIQVSIARNSNIPRTSLPPARPAMLTPPEIKSELPDADDVLYPTGFRKLQHYIYPYLTNTTSSSSSSNNALLPLPLPLPPPKDYTTPRTPSPAGGGEGGNPALWDVLATVSVAVKNTGPTHGQEVVQLYVSLPGKDMPVRVLRGFEKVALEPGEEKTVTLELRRRDVSFWDVGVGNWRIPEGVVKVVVGGSSRDERGVVEF